MAEPTRVGDIDLSQDLRHERRAYRLRQVFAAVFALVLLAGLLGLLGRSGALSDTTVGDDRLAVSYERFLRLDTTTDLRVRIGTGGGTTDVAISRSLLEDVRIEGYSVEPERTAVLPDRVVFTFTQRPPSEITFTLEPQRLGRHRGDVRGPDGAAVHVSQWVWP